MAIVNLVLQIILLDYGFMYHEDRDTDKFRIGHGCCKEKIFEINRHRLGTLCTNDAVEKKLDSSQIRRLCVHITLILNEITPSGPPDPTGIRFLWTIGQGGSPPVIVEILV